MATIHFYEKPGCLTNAGQKKRLAADGHLLIVHDLLHQPWAESRAKLRSFFANRPVAEWFNVNAPAIKNGEIDPHDLTEQLALTLMIQSPLLIRRPLIEVNGYRCAGFDPDEIYAHTGTASVRFEASGLEACSNRPERRGG